MPPATKVMITRALPAIGERMSVHTMAFDASGERKSEFCFCEGRSEINSGELQAYMLPSVAGNIMATPGLSGKNAELAKEIQQKVIELTKEYKVR